jgi:hypothetical protein
MDSIIPAAGDKMVGPTVFKLLRQSVKDKDNIGLHAKIKRNHELRMGEHWKNPSKRVPFVVANLIFNHMQKNCNLLTDNNPVFNVAKMGEVSQEQEDNFELLQRTAEHWWNEQEQQQVFEDTVLNGEEYGITIEYTKFNRELEWGVGEVETLNVDPLYFGFYPPKLKNPRFLQKCEAVFYFYPISVREIKRRWPETGKDVKPDEELITELQDDRREISQKSGSESKFYGALITLASEIKEMLSFKFGDNEEDQETLACECWCKDYTYEKLKDGSKKPKYPGFIRRIICCNGGKIVLSDDPNPSINPTLDFEQARKCFLFDKYPFYARNSVRDTSNFWGLSDMEQLERLNMEFNKSLSQLTLTKDRKARAKIINPITSGVENDEFTNTPGIIRPANAIEAQAIKYLTFDGDINDYIASLNLFKEIFYTVAGTFELDQANSDGKNVIAYKAIAALIEQASTMRKGKIRAYSAMIRDRGRCYISLAQNWYTEQRWITYSKDGGTEAKAVTGTDLLIPARLTVVTGSTMPVSQVQKREEAIGLYRERAIDQEALLEELDWSNRKDVLRRMKEGPFGVLAQRLEGLQMPPGVVQYIQQLGMMDDKEFQRGIEKGEFPAFSAIVQQLLQESQGQEPPPDPIEQLELQEKQAGISEKQAKMSESQAKAAKTKAEIALINEKIKTEQVEQVVKMSGIEFDDEKLKIERARLVNDLAAKMQPDKGKQSESQQGRSERGIRSNNASI